MPCHARWTLLPLRSMQSARRRPATCPQLQRDRRQIVGSGTHDVLANGRRAGEDDMVQRQAGKRLCNLDTAAEHGDLVTRENPAEHALQHLGAARRKLRHLDHHAVACGQRHDQRTDGFHDREIPGCNDADDALRLVDHPGTVGFEQQVGTASLRLHPLLQIGQRVVDLQRGKHDVEHLAFELRAATEVIAHGLRKGVLVVAQGDAKRLQVVPALFDGRTGLRQASRTLQGQGGLQLVDGVRHVCRSDWIKPRVKPSAIARPRTWRARPSSAACRPHCAAARSRTRPTWVSWCCPVAPCTRP